MAGVHTPKMALFGPILGPFLAMYILGYDDGAQ